MLLDGFGGKIRRIRWKFPEDYRDPSNGDAGGWSAWPERVAGVPWPLAGLAALVSLGLPGVPGPLPEQG